MSDCLNQQDQLRSRRNFLNLLKGVAVGVGAACVLGVRDADAFNKVDPNVNFKSSTGPIADPEAIEAETDIEDPDRNLMAIREVKVDPDDPLTHMAQPWRRQRRRFWRRRRRRVRRRIIIR
jgi:hypothetical protein